MSYTESVFNEVVKGAQQRGTWYICLMERAPFYGGPEEGGWWSEDVELVAWKEYPSEELAQSAAERVESLAAELQADAQRDYGDSCLREMDWLEARGLDADFLPEPDGPSEFYVLVTEELPEPSRGSRSYS